jgi:hypothetical protein
MQKREPRDTKKSEAWGSFEQAERLSTTDPAAAFPLLQKALRDCRKAGGVLCLESQGFSLLGWILGILGRTENAESAFRVAYRSGCPCCKPAIDRRFAHLLDWQNRSEEAVNCAIRAVEMSTEPLKGLAFLTLGTVRGHAGDVAGAIRDHVRALRLISVQSPHHPIALANLLADLTKSDERADIARAVEMLPGLKARFHGIKRLSQQRAKLAWMSGGALARYVVVFELTGWTRHGQLAESRHDLTLAVSSLERLSQPLPLEIAAARVDLAAVELLSKTDNVAATLAEVPDVPLLASLKATAIDVAGEALSTENRRQLWAALRELRDATVAAGCAPPLVPYLSPETA